MKYMIIAIIVLLITIFFVICPPSNGKLPAFTDADGKPLEGSIAEKGYTTINGFEIGYELLGENVENPVLLVCGGGPGIPQYVVESLYPSVLPKYFTVCYFDYRGTGLSYQKVNPEEMTTELFLSDVDGMTDYLRERFHREKVYLMGHSFGTYLALQAAFNHPEKYEAYLAVSQNTCQRESEYLAYDYMLGQYHAKKDDAMVAKFEKYPIKDSREVYREYATSGLRDKAMHELGVGTTRDMHSVIWDLFFPSLRIPAYTITERINLWRGKIQANRYAVTNEDFNFDAFGIIKNVEIPIYFFAGAYDYTVCEKLQKMFYEGLQAPDKQYYLYPEAAHSPIYEDPVMTSMILESITKCY